MLDLFSSQPPLSVPAGRQAEQEIVDRLLGAIAERALRPGTKLTEEDLAEAFGVSRARVRKILAMLAGRGVVTLEPNRGAFVAEPTLEDTAHLFEARRVIERQTTAMVAALPAAQRRRAAEALDRHVAEEDRTRSQGGGGRLIRLSGEFHCRLAEWGGNPVLASLLEPLVLRTSLALAAHASRHDTDCGPAEHRAIVDAIRAGQVEHAVRLVTRHLEHVAGTAHAVTGHGATGHAATRHAATGPRPAAHAAIEQAAAEPVLTARVTAASALGGGAALE